MRRILLLSFVALAVSACGLGQDAQSANQAIGAIDPAADAQAKTDLQTALVAGQQAYMSDGSYSSVTPAALSQIEPALQYVSGNSTGPNSVSVAPNAAGLSMAVLSTSGNCFFAVATTDRGTLSGSARASCSAANAAKFATQAG